MSLGLAGHGAAPERLALAGRVAWQRSVDQGIALARCLCPHMALIGFSTGGLLALRSTALVADGVIATVAVNPSLRLRDPRVHHARPVDRWNRLVPAPLRLAVVANDPAWPDTNYAANPIHALAELMRLGAEMRRTPPRLRCPALLLQADHDDVVDPRGVEDFAHLLGDEVRCDRIASGRHACLRGPGAELVWRRIGDFIDDAASHSG